MKILKRIKINLKYYLGGIPKYVKEIAEINKLTKDETILLSIAVKNVLQFAKINKIAQGFPASFISVNPNDDNLWVCSNDSVNMHKASPLIVRMRGNKRNSSFKAYVIGALRDEANTPLTQFPYYIEIRKEYYKEFYPKIFRIKVPVDKKGYRLNPNPRDLTEARKIYKFPYLKKTKKRLDIK